MIYFDRIEVVNMLVPSAGRNCSKVPYFVNSLALSATLHYNHLTVAFVFLICSCGYCEELHCWLWQNSNFQQDPPWTEPVLQCAHTTGGLHWVVWWVCHEMESLNWTLDTESLSYMLCIHTACDFCFADIIDENLKTALQKDLNAMAPGLTIQVPFLHTYRVEE